MQYTANDAYFLDHHRHLKQRNGERVFKLAPLHKSISSLGDVHRFMHAASDLYPVFIACLDNPDVAHRALAKTAASTKIKGR